MKKTILTLAVAAGLFGSSFAIAGTQVSSTSTANVSVKAASPQWLFFLAASKGHLTKIDNNQYALTVKDKDFKKGLAFTDRPYRKWLNLSSSEINKLFNKDNQANSFKNDPPNAVLLYNGDKGAIVTVNGMQTNGDHSTMLFSLLDNQGALANGQWQHIQITIDPIGSTGCWLGVTAQGTCWP